MILLYKKLVNKIIKFLLVKYLTQMFLMVCVFWKIINHFSLLSLLSLHPYPPPYHTKNHPSYSPQHPKDLHKHVDSCVGGVLASPSHHLHSSVGSNQLEYLMWPFTAPSGSLSTPNIYPSSNLPDLGTMDFLKPFKGWSSVLYSILQPPPSMRWWVVVLLKMLVVMLISASPTSGLKTLSSLIMWITNMC